MFLYFITLACSMLSYCTRTTVELKNINDDLVITKQVSKASPFVGIGPQWGGYDNVQRWTGNASLSEQDWNTLFKRVDFLRPGLVRIMTAPGWNYMVNGQYDPAKSAGILFKILDYCEAKGISVMYGEWGEQPVNNDVNKDWLKASVDFLDHLLTTRGNTCIKYLNMLNEPAGSWSSIAGDYNLWQKHYVELFRLLEEKGLQHKVTVIAPDVAIWNDTSLLPWLTNAKAFFGDKIGAYDIHSYPSDDQVKGGSYRAVLEAYRDVVPAGKDMIMGELGFKYDVNSPLGQQNTERIKADAFASDDSNMMIYDAFYGVDVADAVLQNLDAGYNGVILWNMDDAMYDDGNDKLKRWGFWNILGEEKFGGKADEALRPWFYPLSLLSRYIPQGATIYKVSVPGKKGLQAIVAMKNGKYTIAVTNSHTVSYDLKLKMEDGINISDARTYRYVAGEGSAFTGRTNEDGFPVPENTQAIDLSGGKHFPLSAAAKSVIVITNME